MNYFGKKIVTGMLILTIVFSSVFSLFPDKAYAQSGGGGFNLGGLGGMVVQCTDITGKLMGLVSKVFNKIKGKAKDKLSGTAQNSQKVPVADSVNQDKVDNAKNQATVKVEESTVELKQNNLKEQCLDALARFAVLKIMDKITLMTVEWINGGFEGNPFYPEDRPNFFEEIAKDEVISFTGWFSADLENYPFGKILSESILLSVETRLQDNLRYSMNQVLQHQNQYATPVSFNANFSLGGWAGYTALVQPNNNVFGNYLMANQYLARKTAGTSISVAANFQKELGEASGLLNQRDCVMTANGTNDYIDASKETHLGGYPLIPDGQTMTQGVFESLPLAVQDLLGSSWIYGSDGQAFEYNITVKRSTCTQWKTVTPGKFIADQTTQVLGGPFENLQLADEFNENLALIFDALAAQLVKKVGGGLRSLGNSGGGYSSDPTSSNYSAVWAQVNDPGFGGSGGVPAGTAIGGNSSSGGTDIGTIGIQQQYLLQAPQALANLEELIMGIRTLDYCVPGPNPKWTEDADASLYNIVNQILTSPPYDPNVPVSTYYADILTAVTGMTTSPAIDNYDDLVSFLLFTLEKYKEAMSTIYSQNSPPPPIRPTATNLFLQLSEFQSRQTAIEDVAAGITAVLPQLVSIQSQLASLTPAQQANPNDPPMQTIISLFNQIENQGVLVNQAVYDQLVQDTGNYAALASAIQNYITQCVNQEGQNQIYARERVPYPFSSIQNNPLYPTIPASTTSMFIPQFSFGSNPAAATIDLSGFENSNGVTLTNIPTTSTDNFVNALDAIY